MKNISNGNSKARIEINEEYLQEEAEISLERFLTAEELEHVEWEIREHLFELVQDAITEVINYNELMERNKDAKNLFPHFKLFRRCNTRGDADFKLEGTFCFEKDVKEYKRKLVKWSDDEWKVIEVKSPEEVSVEKGKL